jgi:outer membrane protein OmpA-like peptidoglycan-associated protein
MKRSNLQRAVRPFVGGVGVALVVALGLGGCATIRQTADVTQMEEGAAVGGVAGAVVGAVIGAASGSTVKGTILGAVIGGAAGAIIGSQMDEQAEELEEDLESAEVERVGEGIQITFESGILFGFDSADLLPAARDNLSELAESLSKWPDTNVLIVGHTDAIGSDEYNHRLSERRAEAAARFLGARGIEIDRLETRGLGEYEPVASNDTEDGRALNRRVEVAIFANEEMKADARRAVGPQ